MAPQIRRLRDGPMRDEVLAKTLASAGIPVLNFDDYTPTEIEKAIEKEGVVTGNLPFLACFYASDATMLL